MAEFVSSFATGFEEVVAADFPNSVKGVKIIKVYDGFVHYRFDGNSRDLEKVIYFNNTFFVIKTFKNANFKMMVNAVAQQKHYYLINKGSFRVRFIQENQFAKVDKALARKAEETVLANSKLSLDRLSPSTEVWYSIRRDGFSFCGELIAKREFTEKNLNKGELRPEVAYLMGIFAELKPDMVLADVFAGYGSIPVQLIKKFKPSKLYVSDISPEQVELIRAKKQMADERVDLRVADAFELNHISDAEVDCVITDPPWGFYEDIGDIKIFYNKMFNSLLRITKPEGKLVILSARKEELESSVAEKGLKVEKSLHTLINGKKASLYLIKRN